MLPEVTKVTHYFCIVILSYPNQKPLPKLPVPTLSESLEKYLLCIKPLVSDDQYENTKRLVEEFNSPGGKGELLQRKLEAYAEKQENWVCTRP